MSRQPVEPPGVLPSSQPVRPGPRSFLGPVFFHDLVRSSRRGEQVGHRCVYAIVLVGMIAAVYWSWFGSEGLKPLLIGTPLSLSQQARLASSFFDNFMTAQLVVVLLITPLTMASAIAEQKECRTLDCLFVTDLSNREIILGLLGARLAKLVLLVMTGLPILSLLEFLGGVEPGLVLATFVATCMLMVSLGSVSILASVYGRTVLGAVSISYVASFVLVSVTAFWARLPGAYAFVVAGQWRSAWHAMLSSNGLIVSLIVFSCLQGGIAILCCQRAIAQLRRVALAEQDGMGSGPKPAILRSRRTPRGGRGDSERGSFGPHVPRRSSPSSSYRKARPRVGSNALLWKELHAESGLGDAVLRRLHPGAALAALAVLIWFVLRASESVQSSVRQIEIVLTCAFLLMVALSASRRVSRERERRTLDPLLLLPVSAEAILFAKWLGSILSVRRLAWVLGPVWAFGVATGALHVFAVPLLAATTVVYMGFAACLGLWFSTSSGSTLRASLFTLLATLLILTVPSLGSLATLGAISFSSADLLDGRNQVGAFAKIFAAIVLVHGYLVAAVFLWILTRARFAAVAVKVSHDHTLRRRAGGEDAPCPEGAFAVAQQHR